MDVIHSATPLYAVAVSLAASVLIALSGRMPNLREFWTIGASCIKFALVLSLLPDILNGRTIECPLFTVMPGLDLSFRVDALGMGFAITASLLWIVTSFYSIGYVRTLRERSQTRYFTCFSIALSAALGVAFSANMFTTFVFYEIITLCTFPLVAHKESAEAIRGARRYVVYLLGTSIVFQLSAILLTYDAAGTLDFKNGGIFPETVASAQLIIIFVLFIAGIAKAAIMPIHSWLPAAMVAPTPVSALLHAVAVVKAGVFVIVKIVLQIFGVDTLAGIGAGMPLAYVASFTILVASVIALRKDNLKARLAYSTVSQLSYVILGVALLTPSAILGSFLQIVLHAFGKITLFFAAGAIYVASRKTEVSQLDGLGRLMPFTMTAFAVGAFSMIGIPPLGGFLSKWYIAKGSLEASELPILLVIAFSTILNACYFMPIVYRAFFKKAQTESAAAHAATGRGTRAWAGMREAPALMVVPLVLTAIATVAFFFVPSIMLDLARMVSADALGGR